MFNSNPFAELAAVVDPTIMQIYIIIMALLVAGGTLFDIVHKRSAIYFFNNWRKSKTNAKQKISGGKMASIAIQTALVEGATSAEFCSMRRRIAHLLTMYGFIAYVAATAIMVFAYPTTANPAPAILANFWYLGALLVCVGGYWFWFFIRVDVSAEGNSPFRLVRADLFVVSLMASTTLGLYPDDRKQLLGKLFSWLIPAYDNCAVRIRSLVQVFTYVLQAGRRFRKADVCGERHTKQSARTG